MFLFWRGRSGDLAWEAVHQIRMSSQYSMVAAGGDGGTPSVLRRPVACRCGGALPRTRSAPMDSPLPAGTFQTAPEMISPARPPPAAGVQIGGDEEWQQTSRQLLRSPPGASTQQDRVPAGLGGLLGDCDVAEEMGQKWLKEMRGSLLVVASLLASVTYQAGMNPPGGLWQDSSPEGTKDPHRAGDPVLLDTDGVRFQLFNIFNSMAFAYSVGAMMQLITESVVAGWPGGPRRFRSLLGFGSVRTMKYMMILSLLYLAVAFAAGSCRNWWCSLGAVFSPLSYSLSCVVFDLLYLLFRRREQRKLVPTPVTEQVEIAVETHGIDPGADDSHAS